MTIHSATEAWLRRLAWALQPLAQNVRDEIVMEFRSHIEERISQGKSIEETLDALGNAESHAQPFLEDFELSKALGSQDLGGMIGVAMRRLHRSIRIAAAILIVSLLGVLSAGIALTAVMHFFDPAHWGLWLTEHMLLFGRVDDPAHAQELAGAGIYPIALVAVFVSWSASRHILRRALMGLPRHNPTS